MKNKNFTALNVIITILLTFSILASAALAAAYSCAKSPDFCLSQISSAGTYNKAYDSLMKKFRDSYSVTSVPIDVYEEAFTIEWVKFAIDEQVRSSFEQLKNKDAKANIDFSKTEECMTAYFEKYASENHVIKDEVYEQKLKDSISNANKTAESIIDVYRLSAIKKAGLWDKVGKLRNIISKVLPVCGGLTLLLAVLLIFLKRPLYWIGTAAFAAGCIMTVPMIYVKISKLIMKFSIKEFTTYTLMTGTMNSLANTVLYTGIAMLALGIILIVSGIALIKRKNSKDEAKA